MRLISHRGNLWGPDRDWENRPTRIDFVISEGYDVEVDVWSVDSKLYLGHDGPKHEIDLGWLLDRSHKLWCHAKNLPALMILRQGGLNCFWHQKDDYTLTSHGLIWTYPGKAVNDACVLVVEGYPDVSKLECRAICTDYPAAYHSGMSLAAYLKQYPHHGPEQVSTGEQKA